VYRKGNKGGVKKSYLKRAYYDVWGGFKFFDPVMEHCNLASLFQGNSGVG